MTMVRLVSQQARMDNSRLVREAKQLKGQLAKREQR